MNLIWFITERVPSPCSQPMFKNSTFQDNSPHHQDMYQYRYEGPVIADNIHYRNIDNQHPLHGGPVYRTLPTKKTQIIPDINPERSVTPDITRGLTHRFRSANNDFREHYAQKPIPHQYHIDQRNLGIPVSVPQIGFTGNQVPYDAISKNAYASSPIHGYNYPPRNYPTSNVSSQESAQKNKDNTNDSIKISPIDPRNTGGFHSSTPLAKQEIKAAVKIESKLLSPKKSTMSNEELYAVIHKSKKKLNITNDQKAQELVKEVESPKSVKSPETGYIGDKSRSRLSWSPGKGEYVEFNSDIDKLSPPNESRTRQSWACNDRKGSQQTSRLDFKKLLLQHGKSVIGQSNSKKLSAVEQLKLSKQQVKPAKSGPSEMSILEYSGSPKSLINRKFGNAGPAPPVRTPEKSRAPPKLLSPRSQWRFASPRSDVLSSTILEDCREDESPNSSTERKSKNQSGKSVQSSGEKVPKTVKSMSKETSCENQTKLRTTVSQRLQAQRAQFFNMGTQNTPDSTSTSVVNSSLRTNEKDNKCSSPPTLETAF